MYDEPFRADIVGSTFYSPNDPDWACEEAWVPKNRFFDFPNELSKLPWQERQSLMIQVMRDCLMRYSSASSILKAAHVLTIGFVDGDLKVVNVKSA